mgnify:CR=1 FL=1
MPLSTASNSNQPSGAPKRRIATYSFSWAATIVQRARDSHPRGWEILDPILRLRNAQLAFLIASNSPEWPQIRSLAKQLDVWAIKQALVNPKQALSPLLALDSVLRLSQKTLISPLFSYLTANLKELTLEEQLKEGPGPSGPGQPFGGERSNERIDRATASDCPQ